MKISVKQYAQALFEEVKGKKPQEAKAVIEKFAALLKDNNSLHLIDKIEAVFTEIWNKENGIVFADVATVRELHKDEKNALNAFIKERTDAEEVVASYQVNKEILGGAVIRYGDKVLDASMKKRLEEMKERISK